jgi:hypothetical protein
MRFAIAVIAAAFLMLPMQSRQASSAEAKMTEAPTLHFSAAKKKAAKKKPAKVEYLRAVPAK